MNALPDNESPITAARLTPPGRGAVASIRLTCRSADQAVLIDNAFTAANGLLPSASPVNRVLFGSWREEDVVVVRTADTEWEVHCHGGEAAVTRILREFHVVEPAQPESEIESLLLQTRTTRTAQLVLAQSTGVLRDALAQAAAVDSETEFRQELEDLLQWDWLADHLVNPRRVVIAGPPNVGKSSLLNAVAGYDRAIVYDQPGTTRDAVHTELVLNGWPFCFVDTAGIRQQTDDPVESLGIDHARRLLDSASLVLIAVDALTGWTEDHDGIIDGIPTQTPVAIVCCRCDLGQCDRLPASERPAFHTSAVQGTGLSDLTDWITSQLIPRTPAIGTPLPIVGTQEVCTGLLRQLEEGNSLANVQQQLAVWLQTRSW